MSQYWNEKRAQRASIIAEMGLLLTQGTPEALSRRKELDERQKGLLDEIETGERRMTYQLPGVDTREGSTNFSAELTPWESEAASPDYAKSFRNWTKGGNAPRPLVSLRGESPIIHETRVSGLYEGGATAGETLVPTGFQSELEIKMKYYSGMRQACRILKTPTGNPMPWPIMDDTTNVGEILSEGTSTASASPIFNSVTLSSNLASSKQVLVSVQLEQDSFTDIAGLLSDAFAIRIGRLLNTQYTVGTGPIYGLLSPYNGSTPSQSGIVGNGNSVLAVGANSNSGNSGDTDLSSIGTTDLSNCIEALDYSYVRPTSKFMFHQSTLNYLRRVQDKYGRPLFNAALASDVPETIYGYGYVVNNDMPVIGAGNISVVFGNFDKYILRDSLGITLIRFDELFMSSYQRAYQAFGRFDGKLLQPAAFSYLIHPDS